MEGLDGAVEFSAVRDECGWKVGGKPRSATCPPKREEAIVLIRGVFLA